MTTLSQTAEISLSLFERHVKQALKWYDDPERLGADSPLASLYLLGRALRGATRPISDRTRGETLRSVLRAAAARLWAGQLPTTREELLEAITVIRRDPTDPRYAYVVLELRCFHQYLEPYRTSDIWEQPHLLPGSKSQHYRDYDEAIKRLAQVLLDTLRPTVRPEQPREPGDLYGYTRQIGELRDALDAPRTVLLTGPGGIGKTSVSARSLVALDRPIFWYTLRPGFNDGISSLLFAVGLFLQEHGRTNLWDHLVSTNGVVQDLNLAAGLVRQDLAGLREQRPILCLDDLEHLTTASLAPLSARYTQILDLIDGMRGEATLLLISQRLLPGCDITIELPGLRDPDILQLWGSAGHALTADQAHQLQRYTGGNPRLLTLMLAIQHESHEPVSDLEAGAAPMLPAFQRIWKRLTGPEQRAIQQLSVYQGYAPEDTIAAPELAALTRLRLIERDGHGGVALLPALAPFVAADLTPELSEQLHRNAATVRIERGELTSAAYHFAQSGQESLAVQSWFPQRRHAIARGEADAARAIFTTLDTQRLDAAERKALDIIRAELHQFAGQHAEAVEELATIDTSDESEASAYLAMLRGEMEDALGYPERALASYSEGIQVTTRLLSQLAILEQRRGMLLLRRRELEQSWQEVRRAEFDLAILHGLLLVEEGSYDAALEANQRALRLAEQVDDDRLRARAERQIAGVYGRRQQLDQGVTHAARAIAIYERLGDQVNLAKMRSNLAFIYVQTRQFQPALEVGRLAYDFFTAMRDPYFTAVTGANLAEASCELGDHAQATDYANQVLALGQQWAIPYAEFTLGQVQLAQQCPGSAIAHFSESMRIAQQNDDPYMVAYAQRALGQAHLAASDPARARREIEAALAIFRQINIPGEIATTEQLIASLHQ